MDTTNEVVKLTAEEKKERLRKQKLEWYYRNKEKVSEKYYISKKDEYMKKHEKIMKLIGGVV